MSAKQWLFRNYPKQTLTVILGMVAAHDALEKVLDNVLGKEKTK